MISFMCVCAVSGSQWQLTEGGWMDSVSLMVQICVASRLRIQRWKLQNSWSSQPFIEMEEHMLNNVYILRRSWRHIPSDWLLRQIINDYYNCDYRVIIMHFFLLCRLSPITFVKLIIATHVWFRNLSTIWRLCWVMPLSCWPIEKCYTARESSRAL